MHIRGIDPPEWAKPRGYSNGMCVEGAGRLLFVAGQVAWDENARIVGAGDFTAQFGQALRNVLRVVAEAGGEASHIVRLTIFVLDKRQYLESVGAVGQVYREIVGRHYPATSLIEVAGLLEEGALVEIEATAALPKTVH